MAPQAAPKISLLSALRQPLAQPRRRHPPLPMDQKDRLRQAARPPPCQPGRSSTAACASVRAHASQSKQHGGFAFTERARWQPEGTTARRRALLHGATSTARAQQHGGARFHRAAMAPRQQPEHASTEHGGERFYRCGHGSQGTAARRRALLSDATSARAKQHGGVCFHKARRVGPGPPSLSLWPWVAGFFCRDLGQPRPALSGATRA